MFEKLINDLKQSLPEPLRKKLGIADENTRDEEYSEEDSESSHDSSNNESENSGEDKKKKQISMIIRVVVIIALGYLAVDHFLLSDNSQEEIANIPVKPRKPKIKPPPKANEATEAKTAEANADEALVKVVEDAAAIKPEEKPVEITEQITEQIPEQIPEQKAEEVIAPVENINIAEKQTEEPVPPKIEEKAIDETPILNNPGEAAPSKVGEIKSSEQVDKSIDSLIDSVDAKDKIAEEPSVKKETRLEDKIVADDNYVEPPVYDRLGRGLVYNCKEKYWACVDKLSYVNCNKNMKWNKSHGKSAECAVVNVYNTDDDCGVVQKYNISTSQPTPFCQ